VQPMFGMNSFSNDLLAAVKGDTATAPVYFIPLSRAAVRKDIAAQLRIYEGRSAGQDPVCRDQYDGLAPTPVDLTQEQRPFLGELGLALWMMPNWFVDGFYHRIARGFCESGNYVDNGRYDPPCTSARLPVITLLAGGIFVCAGAWQTEADSYIRIWEELGHYAAGGMGLHDNGTAPTAADATLSNLPLSALQEARSLFGERTGTCQAGPRCAGFTGIGGNYDAGGRQHSFIYTLYFYVHDGDAIRGFIDEDLEDDDDLLQRKYNWVRQWIFRGVEFGSALDPHAQL
jgi:hypothetical protein